MWVVLYKAIMESVSKNGLSITDVCQCMSDDVLTFMNNGGSLFLTKQVCLGS